MTRQQVSPPKKFMKLKDFWRFVRQHKWIATLVVALLVLAVTVGICSYIQYTQRFSKQDFDTIETMAETVLKNSGGKNILASRTCSYERPTEISALHLYCHINMVSYVPYENDQNALQVGGQTERQIKSVFGNLAVGYSHYYQQPQNSVDTAVTYLQSPLPKAQCNFHIQSNRYAEDAVPFGPIKTDNNLIALSFECSGESRAEYFPVTYRQG